jgi:predicted acylesterase/phospholipase RssA
MNRPNRNATVAALAGRRIDAAGSGDYGFRLERRDEIRTHITDALVSQNVQLLVCSAACGSDLIALEVAEDLNIPCRIVLPCAREKFLRESVIDRPGNWEELFQRVVDRAQATGNLITLPEDSDSQASYEKANEVILSEAQHVGGVNTLAIVVWEGRKREGGDLTDDFREGAFSKNLRVLTILTKGFTDQAKAFFQGRRFPLLSLDRLWIGLKSIHELSLARRVLSQLREQFRTGGQGCDAPATLDEDKWCREEALLTSKDPALSASIRHDRALEILRQKFPISEEASNGVDRETLGIAGGILKRRWMDLGQLRDLRRSLIYYEQAIDQGLGEDAYPHINAAYLYDRLAAAGFDVQANRARARGLREQVIQNLSPSHQWWNIATRVEAYVGLGRLHDAAKVLTGTTRRPDLWELQTTTRQLANIAQLTVGNPLSNPDLVAIFQTLMNGPHIAVLSAISGKMGLALSGGGLRASFFHLGVLARLAELDILRHVEVLSCVSGGSIVGAYYWLALKARLSDPTKAPMERADYVQLVDDVIRRFQKAADCDIRRSQRLSKLSAVFGFLCGKKGALDSEQVASALDTHFYNPLSGRNQRLFLHDLPFTPADHDPFLCGSMHFDPAQHNWLRSNKVPELVLNATTLNTGHAWQFTTQRMGESPWAIHPTADSIPRMDWAEFDTTTSPKWCMELSRAVAASAAVPLISTPVDLGEPYEGVHVKLMDGGVHDNQGTVSLLAQDCNIVLVSDACGQLLLQEDDRGGVVGLLCHAKRVMDTLMERVRMTTFADLASREQTGTLQGFMFLHLKSGLSGGTRTLRSQSSTQPPQANLLSPAGINRDFQAALSRLRTDLNVFTTTESHALMACGYQMADFQMQGALAALCLAATGTAKHPWPFATLLQVITAAPTSKTNQPLLDELRRGATLVI